MLPVLFYLPVAIWLALFTVANYSSTRIPTWFAGVFFLLGSITTIYLHGWFLGGFTVVSAFLIGTLFAYLNVTTRETTILVSVTLACLPVTQWWVLLPGLVAAVLVSAYRIRKAAGAGYLTMLAGETYASVGMPGGVLSGEKTDLSRIPLLPEEGESEEKLEMGEESLLRSVRKVQIRLAPYLLASVLLIAGLSALVFAR